MQTERWHQRAKWFLLKWWSRGWIMLISSYCGVERVQRVVAGLTTNNAWLPPGDMRAPLVILDILLARLPWNVIHALQMMKVFHDPKPSMQPEQAPLYNFGSLSFCKWQMCLRLKGPKHGILRPHNMLNGQLLQPAGGGQEGGGVITTKLPNGQLLKETCGHFRQFYWLPEPAIFYSRWDHLHTTNTGILSQTMIFSRP